MRLQFFTITILLLLASQCACTSVQGDVMKLEKIKPATKEASGDELIRDYKRWTRVNPVPAVFNALVSAACASVVTQSSMEQHNPHRDKFITVYVNEIGRKSMMEEKLPHFPQGSIIVKEKLTTKDSTSPELLTVMFKREPGFNPQSGDWEYMALDGAGKQVQARGRIEHCQGCHMMVDTTDFVYRSYLPEKISAQLR
jgi:hypothetical protein